jgi:hypothetical protein
MGHFVLCVLSRRNGPQAEGDGVWQCAGEVRPPDHCFELDLGRGLS